MAATMMRIQVASPSQALGAVALDARGSQFLKAANARVQLGARLGLRTPVRCQAGEEPKSTTETPAGLAGSFDRATKKTIAREEVLENQATNESEQRSVFGTKPAPGALYPRPEVERRPEIGSRSPWSVFAFDGAAPETINGRLAMVGFVWSMVVEKLTGLSSIDQVFGPNATGIVWFVASVQVLTYASLVPIFNAKESTDARSFGPFTAKAERWNGRAAMIGFFSLIVTELFLQGPILKLFVNSSAPF